MRFKLGEKQVLRAPFDKSKRGEEVASNSGQQQQKQDPHADEKAKQQAQMRSDI